MNMVKVLLFRFQQCLGTFTMLLVEAFSETGIFTHLSGSALGVCNFEFAKSIRVIFFAKCSKFHIDFKNPARNCKIKKKFFFLI